MAEPEDADVDPNVATAVPVSLHVSVWFCVSETDTE